MNHFFAIELSQEARQTVQQLAEEWRPLVMPASWYAPEDYHITLKFLGNIDEAEQPRLIEAALPVAAEMQPFVIRAASPGGFPNMRAPSVLWSGVDPSPELDLLAAYLDQAMAGLGFRSDRKPYHPHITVARCRLRTIHSEPTQDSLVPVDWPLPSERLFAEIIAHRFVLMQTRSGEGRANRTDMRYNLVHTFPFGNTPS